MAISSLSYVVFLLVLWLLAQPMRAAPQRQILLLLASYFFYASWSPKFLAVLIVSSLVNYQWGRILRRQPTAGILWVGIVFNLLILLLFKYLPTSAALVPAGRSPSGFALQIFHVAGVSFWTFQAISYLMDVYRDQELDPSLPELCLYLAFWPTVLSGPVCRLPDLLPQLRSLGPPTWEDVATGTRRLVLGLFMKVALARALADGLRVGEGVDGGYDQIARGWAGLDVWFLAVAFGFQLFFDFAGYSHIVIGSARIFGIRLQENFESPYLATTPSIFWTRWHMSLSFWIRDYIFLPLARLRREVWWRNLSLLVAMTLFGLWHGARGVFILWGAYQGLLLLGHRLGQQLSRRATFTLPKFLGAILGWAATFSSVSLGWILFRSHDLSQAFRMLGAAFSPTAFFRRVLPPNFYLLTALLVAGTFSVWAVKSPLSRWEGNPAYRVMLRLVSPAYYAALIILTVLWSSEKSVFLYLQF